MKRFNVNREPDEQDKYYISIMITVYREKLGCYPEWLKSYDNSTIGWTTTFVYLVPNAIMLSKSDAEKLADELNTKYDTILERCEDTGDWRNSPYDFTNMTLLWSK